MHGSWPGVTESCPSGDSSLVVWEKVAIPNVSSAEYNEDMGYNEAEYNEDMEHNEEMIKELMNTPNFQEDCLKFLNEKVLHDVQMNAGNKFSETFSTSTYKKYRDFFQLFERSPLESLLKP